MVFDADVFVDDFDVIEFHMVRIDEKSAVDF